MEEKDAPRRHLWLCRVGLLSMKGCFLTRSGVQEKDVPRWQILVVSCEPVVYERLFFYEKWHAGKRRTQMANFAIKYLDKALDGVLDGIEHNVLDRVTNSLLDEFPTHDLSTLGPGAPN